MALEKVKHKTLFQRIRYFIMGSEKPNLLTRVSVIAGALIWLYLFIWQLMTFVAMLLIGNVHDAGERRSEFYNLGKIKYGLRDTVLNLRIHSIIQIVVLLIILASLILIWRKRKIGFLGYVGGNIASLFITVLMMGWSYLINEIPIFDFVLIAASTLYFSVGLFIFYRKGRAE